jgi:short subunit dehydrogenase-like uncharacterized protein
MTRSRVHDVVIYGATGFTGQLVARYFAEHVSLDRTPWALAGRNREKLLALREQLTKLHPGCARLPVVVASTDDRASLAALSKNARVVLTTVGPFARHGEPLFQACAENGTDYVDSCGEFLFVRNMRTKYAERARERGALMVSCCGIDSIPTDLGVYYTLKQLAQASPVLGPVVMEGLLEVRARPSAGTWSSMLSALGELPSAPARAEPPPSEGRVITRVSGRPHHDRELGWVLPFPTLDPEIALQSAASLPLYGPAFSYAHYLVVRTLPKLALLGLGMGSVAAVAQLSLTRGLLARLLPAGTGPSEQERARSWFHLHLRARHAGGELRTEVKGGDPGYGETAKMLAESALCLAVDRARLPARAGLLTPACAFGDVLLKRLQRAGIVFQVVSR